MRFCKAKSCRLLLTEDADPSAFSSRRKEMRTGRRQATSWEPVGEEGGIRNINELHLGKNNPNSPHIILFESGIIIPAYGACACGHACLEHMAGGGQSSPCRLGCQEALGIACF